jgi:hypothetical protein
MMKNKACTDEKQACRYAMCCGERVASNLFWFEGVQVYKCNMLVFIMKNQ